MMMSEIAPTQAVPEQMKYDEGGVEQQEKAPETPAERLAENSRAVATKGAALQNVSTQGTQDLGQAQQSLQEIQKKLGLTEERIQEILGSVQKVWGDRYDEIEQELQDLYRKQEELQQLQQEKEG